MVTILFYIFYLWNQRRSLNVDVTNKLDINSVY
jgi:hypothetical protein